MRWIKTTTLEYRELFDKIFTNRTANGGNAQSITSHNRISEQSGTIDPQLITPLTFDQCGISDMSDESDNPDREIRAQQLRDETSSAPDLFENSIQKNRSTVTPKFKTPFSEEMEKSMGSDFLIQTCTRTTSRKRKSVDIEEHGDSLLEVPTKKEKKAIAREMIAVEMNRWTMQNAVTLEQRRTERMTEEVRAMEDIKKNYAEAIQELSLSKFSALVRALQVVGSNYGGYTAGQYYLLLTDGSLRDQFMEQLLETLEDD